MYTSLGYKTVKRLQKVAQAPLFYREYSIGDYIYIYTYNIMYIYI